MDAKLNSLPAIDDFEKAYLLLQYAHENGFRSASITDLYNWLNLKLQISGIDMAPVPPGSELPTPPSDEQRRITPVSSGSYTWNGNTYTVPEGYTGTLFWNSSSWSLTTQELPRVEIDDSILEGSSNAVAGKAVYNALEMSSVADNLSWQKIYIRNENTSRQDLSDGAKRLYRTSSSIAGWAYCHLSLDEGVFWQRDHQYFFAIDMLPVQLDVNNLSIIPKKDTQTTIGSAELRSLPEVGSRGLLTGVISIALNVADSQLIQFQFGNFAAGQTMDVTLYSWIVIDLTASGVSYEEAKSWVETNGAKPSYGAEPGFVKKIEGKQLSTNDFTDAYKEKVDNAFTPTLQTIYSNLATQFGKVGVQGSVLATTEGDAIRLRNSNTSAIGWRGYNFRIDSDKTFVRGHKYLVAFDIVVTQNTLTEGGGSESGNNYFIVVAKNNAANLTISSVGDLSSLVTGTRGLTFAEIQIADSNVDGARWVYMQIGNYGVSQTFDITVYDMMVIDLTESNLTFADAQTLVRERGISADSYSVIKDLVYRSLNANRADVASSVESITIGGTIDVWGDSLVAQGWGNDLSNILKRSVVSHGYGGKISTYIRDKFLADPNITIRPQILSVGRNNIEDYETIIDDLRIMVSAMGHENYLILMPPNGNYGDINGTTPEELSEFKGGDRYDVFQKLSEHLQFEYADNFLDTRRGTINSYNNGNVRLLEPFVQPQVGEDVSITVSDAVFLTTYNPTDVTKFGSSIMERIAIGGVNGKYDIYEVVSVESETDLTVRLHESNRIAPGGIVQNRITYPEETSSVMYLRVMQNADLLCKKLDTTQSTFRSDAIHMSPRGLACLAEVVARKVSALKI